MIAHLRTIRVIKGKSFWLLFLSFVKRGRKKKNRVIKKKSSLPYCLLSYKKSKTKKKKLRQTSVLLPIVAKNRGEKHTHL